MLLPPPFRQREALAALSARNLIGRLGGPELAGRVRREMDREGLVPDPSLEAYTAGIARALGQPQVIGLEALERAQDPRAAYYYNGRAAAMAAHLTPPSGSRWDAGAVAALREDVRGLGTHFQLVGPAIFLPQIRAAILREAGLAVALSFTANLVLVWLLFRRWRRVALVMVPVTAATILTVGAMGILGLSFNFFNVAGIALVFGFGVDYGIYLMQAHLEGRATAEGDGALRRVGGAVVLCALTTVASCGSLITSHYRGLASIGAVLSLGAVFCLAATLLLVPAVLALRERRRA
jgi:predicted RND superfamily exporter protein